MSLSLQELGLGLGFGAGTVSAVVIILSAWYYVSVSAVEMSLEKGRFSLFYDNEDILGS